jgi:pyruvate formate lyase activating enzyme
MSSLPRVFDIRRGSLDDGPGIRTTVFFKGCPLACTWCHNPESFSPESQLSFSPEWCIGDDCGSCGAVCPEGKRETGTAVAPGSPDCSGCRRCILVCPTGARREIGRVYSLDDLCTLLLRDVPYYRSSGGGVTLSGGEPTLHHDYVAELLAKLKKEGVHTVLQTCGDFSIDPFCRDLLPLLDMIFFDVKLVNARLHRRYTGRDNETILANLCGLASRAPERLVVRVPLVPGITATQDNLIAIARILRDLGLDGWELLPYNPGGLGKRKKLGQEVPAGLPERFMGRDEERELRELFLGRLAKYSGE